MSLHHWNIYLWWPFWNLVQNPEAGKLVLALQMPCPPRAMAVLMLLRAWTCATVLTLMSTQICWPISQASQLEDRLRCLKVHSVLPGDFFLSSACPHKVSQPSKPTEDTTGWKQPVGSSPRTSSPRGRATPGLWGFSAVTQRLLLASHRHRDRSDYTTETFFYAFPRTGNISKPVL